MLKILVVILTTRKITIRIMRHRSNQPRARNYTGRRPVTTNQATRPVAYSYHQNRALTSEKSGRGNDATQLQKRRIGANRLKLIMALTVIIIVLILELPVSSNAKIVIAGGSEASASLPTASYQTAAEHILSSSLTDHTKLTLNSSTLAAQLKKQFPEINSVNVSYSVFSWRPTISLKLSQPVLTLEDANNKYLVSNSGIVVGIGSAAKSSLPLVVDDSNLSPVTGRPILPANYVNFISELLAQLAANGVSSSQLVLPKASAELDLTPKEQNYFVKFNLQGNAEEQAGTYLAAAHYLSKQGVHPSSYIDVRLAGRAYYK